MKKFDLLNDNLKKIYLKYLFPSVTSSLIVALYIFVDTMFVGLGVGSDGLAALNISIPLFTVFTAFFLCVGIGGSNLLSIKRERGEIEDGNKIFTNAIIFVGICGIIIAILGVTFTEQIGEILGASENIKGLFKEYFQILVLFTPAFLISGTLGCFIRNDKNPKLVMIATLCANIFNIVFDYILIFEFNMGMRGAVIATVLSPIVNISILIFHFRSKNSTLKILKTTLSFNVINGFLKNGLGTFLLEMSRGVSIFMFNNILMIMGGYIYVAAYGILVNVSYVLICIFSGISQSIQPIISSNFGANKQDRVSNAFLYGISTSIFIGIIAYILCYIFPEYIARMFTTGDELLISIVSEGIRIYFIGCIFMSFNMVCIYFFQSIGKSRNSIIISLCSGILFVIIGFILLTNVFGIKGVWMVFPFAEFLGMIVCSILLLKSKMKFLSLSN